MYVCASTQENVDGQGVCNAGSNSVNFDSLPLAVRYCRKDVEVLPDCYEARKRRR